MATQVERAEQYRAERGYIGTGGTVICGACYMDAWFFAALSTSNRLEFEQEAWERYNPAEGDNWCSICDKNITKEWRHGLG